MSGIVLTENYDSSLEYLVEANEDKAKPKTYRIKGPWMEADQRNRNGRVYPRPIVEREVDRYYKEFVVTKRAVSDLDHRDQPTQTFSNACHLIEDLKMDGNIVRGVARIMDTPSGKIAKTLMDEGVQLAISSRGLGSLDGSGTVGDNFRLFGFDLVVSPSSPSAFVESIVENMQYLVQNDGSLRFSVGNFKKDLDKNGSRNLYNDISKFLERLNRTI